jgi:hypothetical protein
MTSQLDLDRGQLEKLNEEAPILIILMLQRHVKELQQTVATQAAEIQKLRALTIWHLRSWLPRSYVPDFPVITLGSSVRGYW